MNKIIAFLQKNKITILLVTLFILFVFLSLSLTLEPLNQFGNWIFKIKPELLSQYGNITSGFLGPLFSFITIILICITLIIQRKNNKKVLFENTFFNLLKTQQDISNNIDAYFNYLDMDSKANSKLYFSKGKITFYYFIIELKRINESINYNRFLEQLGDIEIDNYYHKIEELYENYEDDDEIKNYKVDNYDKEIRIKYINKIYGITDNIYKEIIEMNEKERIVRIYDLFFYKYRYAIGHYFRHLYHIVKFVKSQSNNNESKKYIDFIQAQMSSFELTLLFYNLFKFEKMKDLVIEFNFLDNLYENELINPSHNCLESVILKK